MRALPHLRPSARPPPCRTARGYAPARARVNDMGDPQRGVVSATALDERQRQPPVEVLGEDPLHVLRREARVEQVVDPPAWSGGDALVGGRRAVLSVVVRVVRLQ